VESAPAGIVTELGTLRLVVADNATTAPAEGAARLSVAVQSVDPPGFNVVGTHAIAESCGVADTINTVVLTFRVPDQAFTVTV